MDRGWWAAGSLLVLVLIVGTFVAAIRDYRRLVRLRDQMRGDADEEG